MMSLRRVQQQLEITFWSVFISTLQQSKLLQRVIKLVYPWFFRATHKPKFHFVEKFLMAVIGLIIGVLYGIIKSQ